MIAGVPAVVAAVSVRPAVILNAVAEDAGGGGVAAEIESLWLVGVAVTLIVTAAVAAAAVLIVIVVVVVLAPAATTVVVIGVVIIPTVAVSIVIVIPVLVAHVGPLLLVRELVGLESL